MKTAVNTILTGLIVIFFLMFTPIGFFLAPLGGRDGWIVVILALTALLFAFGMMRFAISVWEKCPFRRWEP